MRKSKNILFIFLLIAVLIAQPLSNATAAGSYWDKEVDVVADFDTETDTDGDLNDHVDAAHDGDVGLEITFNDGTVAFGSIDAADIDQKTGVISFWFNPNSVALDNTKNLTLVDCINGDPLTVQYLQLYQDAGEYFLRIRYRNDANDVISSSYTEIGNNDWMLVTWMFSMSSGAGNNNGYGRLYIDNELVISQTGNDNDSYDWDTARIGMGFTNSAGFGGSFYVDTIKTRTTIVPVVMGNSSISGVPAGLKDSIEEALNDYRPDSELELDPWDLANMWAVTSYTESDTEDYYWVSLAGMVVSDVENLDGWDLSQSIWTGTAITEDTVDPDYTGHVEGSAAYDVMVDAAGLYDIAAPEGGGSGSYAYYFPWAAGYKAHYGSKGVHDAGYFPDWLAVDWVGGAVGYADAIYPNGAYVSQSGVVSWVCQDDVQTWVRIGDFLYGHLVDNITLREDTYHSQGSYLGALVTGTHLTTTTSSACPCPSNRPDCVDSKCGYMCQQETSYHIHWGFNAPGGILTIEDWTLNTSSEDWTNGIDTVGPGQYMLANWSTRPIVPTPGPTVTPGGPTITPGAPILDVGGGRASIWDGVLAGVQGSVEKRIDDINALGEYGDNLYRDRHLVTLALSGFRIMIRSVYVLLRSNLNLTITMIVIAILFILEPIRILRSVWLALKEMIPMIG